MKELFKTQKSITVNITLLEDMLGTMPNNEDLYHDYVASNAPDASTLSEEIAEFGVTQVEEKGKTVFPRLSDGTPYLYDYQIKGFFKGTCGFLRNVKGSQSEKLKSYKKKIDGLVFVEPRRIPLVFDGECSDCQRPLRASGPSGERVALSSSEAVPAGTTFQFTIKLLDESMMKVVEEWLDYGEYSGIGQWRNSGKGRFSYDVVETN